MKRIAAFVLAGAAVVVAYLAVFAVMLAYGPSIAAAADSYPTGTPIAKILKDQGVPPANFSSAKASPRAHIATVWFGGGYGWQVSSDTPTCYNGYYGYNALCHGYGDMWQTDSRNAWNTLWVCAVQLVIGGWETVGTCLRQPSSRDSWYTSFNGAEGPLFHLNPCVRWFSTLTIGRVLLPGGWVYKSETAPGIECR